MNSGVNRTGGVVKRAPDVLARHSAPKVLRDLQFAGRERSVNKAVPYRGRNLDIARCTFSPA
jgi:hypothetical protein